MAQQEFDIRHAIDSTRLGGFQIGVLVLCALIVIIDGYDASAAGFVGPSLLSVLHVSPAMLGTIFAASGLGMFVGALILGYLADRIGRKAVMLTSIAFFGLFTYLTSLTTSPDMIVTYRFLTGIGLGGCMPMVTTISAEYVPARLRHAVVTYVALGFTVGAIIGSFIATSFLASHGWTIMFIVGGITSLVLFPIALFLLPESISWLAVRGRDESRVRRLATRVLPPQSVPAGAPLVYREVKAPGLTVGHLFRDGRAKATLLFWVVFSMNLLSVYFLGNWLTTLTHSAGFPLQVATTLPAIQSVGAIIGTLVIGVMITRLNGYVVLCGYYVGAAIFLVFIGYFGAAPLPIMIAAFFAGWFVIGSQYGANAMAATYYPTFIRSSGVGWALGVGRAGNIVGPVIGGVMLGTGWSIAVIWFVSACAPAIAAIAVLGVRRAAATARPQTSAAAAE